MSKYGVFSGLYFPAFGLNMGKYGLEKKYLFGHFSRSDTFFVSSKMSSLKKYITISKFNIDMIQNEYYIHEFRKPKQVNRYY